MVVAPVVISIMHVSYISYRICISDPIILVMLYWSYSKSLLSAVTPKTEAKYEGNKLLKLLHWEIWITSSSIIVIWLKLWCRFSEATVVMTLTYRYDWKSLLVVILNMANVCLWTRNVSVLISEQPPLASLIQIWLHTAGLFAPLQHQ